MADTFGAPHGTVSRLDHQATRVRRLIGHAIFRLVPEVPGVGLHRRGFSLGKSTRSRNEGKAPTVGGPWGDYSGTCVEGDNRLDLWILQSTANPQGRGASVILRRTAE